MIIAAGIAAGCAGKPPEPAAAVTWGGADNVVQVGNLYFSAQPDQAGLAAAQAAGVDIVINLRLPDEVDFDQAAAVDSRGMQYFNVPISRDGPSFDPGAIEMISELVAANSNQQILLYCSSGNRASAWYAIDLVRQRGVQPDEALRIARATGLTRASMEQRVQEYLDAGD
ncbi:MAG: hypothetical protein HKN06_13550 [Gammaproteobacteria bacterium]|nr:hypothetical protein [Gammaproteobacteria bacterium]